MKELKSVKARQTKVPRARLKIIVHPDYFPAMPAKLESAWRRSIYRMKKNPKKFLLVVPTEATRPELKAALRGNQKHGGLAGLLSYALKHLGRQRVIIMNFSVLGRVKDYPLKWNQRDFNAWPRQRLQRILESRGIKLGEIAKISASGIYLGECTAGEAEAATAVLGLPPSKIKYIRNESAVRR